MCWAHPKKSQQRLQKLKSFNKAPLSIGKLLAGKGRLTLSLQYLISKEKFCLILDLKKTLNF